MCNDPRLAGPVTGRPPRQIEAALGHPIHHTFPSDYKTVSAALNSGTLTAGTLTTGATDRREQRFQFQEIFAYEKAAHSLKFGADFLYNRVNITFPGALQGVYTFSSLANLQAARYVTYQQAFGAPTYVPFVLPVR